jgi:lipopolysaccharide/colanic/teichoic acid biosynthesis glycosyltransferase/glycosyltransferase involved in cell wall biosynthesis
MDVVVVSSPGPGLDRMAAEEKIKTYAVPICREISLLSDLRSLYGLWTILIRIRPTVTNFGTPKAGLLGGLASALARVPYRIYTLHGLRLETTSGVKRWILSQTERLACACADEVICVSSSLRHNAIELRLVDPAKCVVLGQGTSNGIDFEHYKREAENSERAKSLRQKLGIPKDASVIGFVGRFTKDKGIGELLEAYNALRQGMPELRLLLVGDFEDGDPVPQPVREQIESDAFIVTPGFVSDTAPYYPIMDVLALPTYREGFPGVPLEAAAAGKPVVTTNATGAIDAVLDGETGLVVPVGDAVALAAALEKLLRNAQLRTEMGLAGQERVRREFRHEVVLDRWVNEYRQALQTVAERQKKRHRQSGWRLLLKRSLDVTAGLAALILVSPLMLVTAAIILVSMGRPVIFRQQRPGRNKVPFTLFKFRTMRNERDKSGRLLPDAERLSTMGRLLRAMSLDELPQLWNVLRGDLSLVGPRPLLMQYLDRYTPEQTRRHEVLPGITGWAQVNGRNALSWSEKFSLDVWYVDHWSLALDLRILWKTLWQVVTRRGVSQQGHATMPEFNPGEAFDLKQSQ